MNLLDRKAGRSLIAFALYFAEGAPIGFIWWAMPTILRQQGVAIDTVTAFTAALTFPWVLKFLWAPLIDIFHSSKFGFTKWIGWSQFVMCLTLLPLVFIPIGGNLFYWGLFLLMHSLAAATQDVSVDALIINVVAREEKGVLNGFMQAGMLTGRSIFGGAALMIVPVIGLSSTILIMILTILGIIPLLFFIKEQPAEKNYSTKSFGNSLYETFRKKQTWLAIAFALTSAAAFEAAGGMTGVFLTDKQMDMGSIGFFFGLPVVFTMLLGGMLGGFLSDKMSRKKSVTVFILAFVLVIFSLAIFDMGGAVFNPLIWMTLFAVMYFFAGMFVSSSYALFMDISNPKLAATEFSTFMAATNGCEAWVVWSAGAVAASMGYGMAFAMMCLVSLASLLFLRKI